MYSTSYHALRRSGSLPRLFAVILHILLLAMSPWAAAADASFGVHGMVLFGGKDGLYASHLPMFHAPHDTQVVLRVRFADPDLDRAMRARLDGRTALWTLDPERFALRRLAPQASDPVRSFTAHVVEGHFEQGGTVRHRAARLAVDEVLVFRPLDPALSTATVSHYLPVGPFLVKRIDSRPDFDHIVLLKEPARAAVSVGKVGLEEPLPALAERAPVVGTVYYGTDDLR